MIHNAVTDQHAGRYVQAEAEALQAMTLLDDGRAYEVLAQALNAQGKTQEALQAYHIPVLITDGKDGPNGHPRNLLSYAPLLLKSGQWAQALAAYNAALPLLPDVGYHTESPIIHDEDIIRANSHFSTDAPDPANLAVMIHIANGMFYNAGADWVGEPQNKEAFAEYGKARQLAPKSNMVNYYYGFGLQKLSPAEQQFGSIQQARAALTKEVKLGKGPIKVKAQKALLVAMTTK